MDNDFILLSTEVKLSKDFSVAPCLLCGEATLLPMINPYYPTTNDGRADWWQNIVGNIGTLSGLGFTVPQTTSITADATLAVYLYRTLPSTFEEFGKRVTGFINTYLSDPDGSPAPTPPSVPGWPAVPASASSGIEARREKWVQAAKHTTAYDPGVQGAVLRIEPTGTPFDPATYQAEIFGATSPSPGTVQCKFRKARGNIDAMAFFGRRGGTVPLVSLGRFTSTPATFTIPLLTPGTSETWDLQGRALIKDVDIGSPSDLVQVIVRG